MNLYQYIAHNNSSGANELLSNYGFQATKSINELIDRLKIIVRKYKKVALQDISEIHPDKSLLSAFTLSTSSDKEFSYATGRTPGFAEPVVVEPTPFEPAAPTPFIPTPAPTVIVSEPSFDASKVVEEIKGVKKDILKDKLKRSRRDRERRMMKMQSSMGSSPILLLAVGFAVGYIIAKK